MFFELLFPIGGAPESIFQVLDLFLELHHLVFLLAEQARVVQHPLPLRVLHRITDASLHQSLHLGFRQLKAFLVVGVSFSSDASGVVCAPVFAEGEDDVFEFGECVEIWGGGEEEVVRVVGPLELGLRVAELVVKLLELSLLLLHTVRY